MKKNNNRKNLTIQILVFCFCLFFSLNVQAQDSWVTLPNGEQVAADKDRPQIYRYENRNGEMKIRERKTPEDVVKVIVTLKDKPLALYKSDAALRKVSLMSVLSSLKQEHSTVANKIEHIAGRLSNRTNFQYSYKINREYFTALNGMAMECNQGMIQYIRELPDVKNVSLDCEVKACLTQSVRQIRADIVQDSLGYTGDGVLVGVVDTGLDYNHSALGSGFGPGYRVIGGYDFINDDSDPYDDAGHGTHVAGIIGANGNSNQIGVAPDVKFLAVKVLDGSGFGLMSGIITGIEYCMDPDGNPQTDDAVDIMNMSLGGSPGPSANPVDAAVNNATQAGILSVIAAGNEAVFYSSPFFLIQSPGTAETALTVGACNNKDQTADFSSWGPDPIRFAIKPEISAPGVDILSLFPNNGMEIMSGTSMSTPHVVGVAALLKEQHPDWNPGQIKAAIINAAKMTGASFYAQGNGRVDALNAATPGVIVEPGTVNFGVVDTNEPVWMDTVELRIKNLRNVSQHFDLQRQGSLHGAELYLSQISFNLAPMEEEEITAIISVPQSVPIMQYMPFSYGGNIICQSDSDRVQIPFAFIKSHVLVIKCDTTPQQLILYDAEDGIDVLGWTGGIDNKFSIIVPQNTYLLLAEMEEVDTTNQRENHYYIFRDSIEVQGTTHISLSRSEAEFVAFNGVDQLRDIYNNPVHAADSSLIDFQIDYLPGYGQIYVGWKYRDIRIFLSPTERFIIHQGLMINYGDQALLLAKFVEGLHSQDDLTFLSGPQNLGDLHLDFDYVDDGTKGPFLQINNIKVYENTFEGGCFTEYEACPFHG